jgi:RNA polymerase sigma factor (sigma-70 family)
MADESPRDAVPPEVPGIYALAASFLPIIPKIALGVTDVTTRRFDPEAWADLCHRVLLNAWITHCEDQNYFARGSARAWAQRTTENALVDGARKNKSDAVRDAQFAQQVLGPYYDDDTVDRIIEDERRQDVFRALQVLDPRRRALIEKHLMEGRSRREVAAELGLTERQAKRWLEQIKARLASILSPWNPRGSDTATRRGDHA